MGTAVMFELARLAAWLVDPTHLVFSAVGVATLLLFTRRWRLGRAMLVITLTASFVLQPVPLGPYLVRLLEGRFPVPTSLPEHVDGIVVLGGDFNMKLVAHHGAHSLGRHGGQRLSAFADLARRYPQARLYFTGGLEIEINGQERWSESQAARVALGGLGLDVARVRFEDQSHNTYDNAVLTHRLAQPQPGETWVLITMARHMPRAIGSFRRAGWTVIAYPVDFRIVNPVAWGEVKWSFGEVWETMNDAMREFAGLASYRLLGRTDALFPGP
jgi:uncharacterized SAM-binding protein YcdF (DUF218 family)